MKPIVVAALLVLVAATEARADLWTDAIARGTPDASRDVYVKELQEGDEHVLQANVQSSSRAEIKRQLQLALDSYRAAAAARPDAAEPYFRIADVLNSFYLEACEDHRFGTSASPLRDCSNRKAFNAQVGQQVIDALNAAEARAPLDPRFSGGAGDSLLFRRATLLTRLATKKAWEAAARDYLRYLERSDGNDTEGTEIAWGNLAETLMMLGKLDDAIDAYKQIRSVADVSTAYGAAVALDRNERGDLALGLIRAQGRDAYDYFRRRVNLDLTFFVPAGEEFYYFALVEEAWGNYEFALEAWRLYLASGAHPQFQPRAKQHIDALLSKKRRPIPLPDRMLELR